MPLPTLASRITSLDVSLLSFGSQDVIGSWKTLTQNVQITTQDGKASSDRYVKKQPTKRKRTFSLTVFHLNGSTRATNLDLTAWSVGGTSRIGDLKNFAMTVTTKTAEASGCRDFDSYGVAMATDMEVTATHFVSSNADLVAIASRSTTLTDFQLAVTFTLAGITFTAPMLLSAASLKLEGEQVQMQDITLELRGTITAPAVGVLTGANLLLASIMTGSAALSYSIDTGPDTEIGYALIAKATLTVSDAAIVEDQFDFETQGLSAAS